MDHGILMYFYLPHRVSEVQILTTLSVFLLTLSDAPKKKRNLVGVVIFAGVVTFVGVSW